MFTGFSDETVDFLWNLRFNNEREWFLDHKQQFQDCLNGPMHELARGCWEVLSDRFPDLSLDCRVCRIYRDARRLFGRGPLKDHLWFSIHRPGDALEQKPGFWFGIHPEYCTYGLGYYEARPLTMAKFRARLDRDPDTFKALIAPLSEHPELVLEGPEYKRSKGPHDPALDAWYDRRYVALACQRPHDDLSRSPELQDLLTEAYTFLMPLYRYFDTLDGDPAPKEK